MHCVYTAYIIPLFDYAELTLLISYALVLITPTHPPTYLPTHKPTYLYTYHYYYYYYTVYTSADTTIDIGTRAYTLPFCRRDPLPRFFVLFFPPRSGYTQRRQSFRSLRFTAPRGLLFPPLPPTSPRGV